MKIKRKYVLLIIAILLAITTVAIFFSIPEVEEVDMYLSVGDYAGLNVDTDAIYFGTTVPGGSANRKIILENDADYLKKVTISATGELEDWISAEENNFVLDKNETKKTRIYVYVPENTEFGNYTGKLRVLFRKVYISPELS